MLEVKNIHKKFGSNEVLKGVDFKVEKGSVIAVLGNSGSGKTTLLRCISFLEQADQGEITFDDFQKDITAVTRKEIKELRMKMGFVLQGYNLFRNKTAHFSITREQIDFNNLSRSPDLRIISIPHSLLRINSQ